MRNEDGKLSKEMRGGLFIGKTILAKISPQNAIKINEKEK